MTIRDRLRRLEADHREPPVEVWLSTHHDPGWATNSAGERRRSGALTGAIEVTLTIDRAAEHGQSWDEQEQRP